MTKDEQRVVVLRFYYNHNEREPGGMEQTAGVSKITGLEPGVVSEAQLYLIDKGFLYTTTRSQPLHGGYSTFLARITDRGIDFIEHPTDFRGQGVPTALVNIVAGGDVSGVTIAGRDQQVVHGNVSGTITQGEGSAASTLTAFPIERLREILQGEPVALAAAERIAEESHSTNPRWGMVVTAAETIKNVGVVGEATHIILGWLNNPAVPEWTQHAVRALLG